MARLFRRVLLLRVAAGAVSSSARLGRGGRFDPSRAVHVSWRPRALLYRGFLSEAECDHLVALEEARLQKSMVVDRESGKSVMSKVRTSYPQEAKKQDEVVANVEERIAAWTLLPQVKPVKSDAVLFFSLHPNATTNPDSLHGSCPVIEGEKWSSTTWIHVRSFDNRRLSATGYEDEDVLCPGWAAKGECANNPGYMVGTRDSLGFCRKSWNVCTL